MQSTHNRKADKVRSANLIVLHVAIMIDFIAVCAFPTSLVINISSERGCAKRCHGDEEGEVSALRTLRSASVPKMKPLFALAEPKSAQLFNPGQRELLLRLLTLGMVCVVSFSIRLFSVLRYESIIHEFDPWFNYRSTW